MAMLADNTIQKALQHMTLARNGQDAQLQGSQICSTQKAVTT